MSSRALWQTRPVQRISWIAVAAAICLLIVVLAWQVITASGNPNSIAPHASGLKDTLNIAILVFREGLECILVLAAITASMTGKQEIYRRPVAVGAGIGFIATLVTWCIAVRILDDISKKISALSLQAATGLLAVIVLLIVMNWFFHKMYWTGWISLHNRRKRTLLEQSGKQIDHERPILAGFVLLGFSSFYREGVEVVLFLQSYRLRLGNHVVFYGVLLGLVFSAVVGILTFIAHRKLPYRKMLVLTGVMLGFVLLVMVGEQAQEMQLAHWLPTTPIHSIVGRIPGWMGLWFSIFPTVETLTGQALALVLVLGSYFFARQPRSRNPG